MTASTDAPIRVVIVDDQALLRAGFRRLLEMEGKGIVVVATARDGQAALDAVERLAQAGTPADVVLMDVQMPHLNGVAATAQMQQHLGRGASNREISEQLFITEGTVKNHVSNILSKLALRDRTQAAIYARDHGLA